ncbi:MAG: glutamate 5-kinase [Nitrospinae bacterium]|nr:glutamate 5-kinase [Nitrospinota bacterium]
MARRAKLLAGARRIVVKVGSGVITGETYTDISDAVVGGIARQVAALVREGRKVAVVSSGSVALGARSLKVPRHGLSIPVKQAAAAVGQGSLISLWGRHLAAEGLQVGQVLLTHDDLSNRRRFLNSRNTINQLIEFGAVPVINENDTVAVHEIKFGDNDTLSARATNLLEADVLAILSDVDGLYTADPRRDPSARKIDIVEKVTEEIRAGAGDSSTRTGLGGMASKVRAADEAAKSGAATIIIPGVRPNSLIEALTGAEVGTFFFPHEDRLSSKHHWIEFTLKPQGLVVVDEGARRALTTGGKSLLAKGVVEVRGEFESGEAVEIAGPDGAVFAKGLVNYHAFELERIKGAHTSDIERILGYKMNDEAIHRDDMVFFTGARTSSPS